MASSIYKAPDVKTIQDITKSEGIDAIHGRPNCHTLINLVNQLCAGARQVHCDYSNFGMMWVDLPDPNEQVVAPLQPNNPTKSLLSTSTAAKPKITSSPSNGRNKRNIGKPSSTPTRRSSQPQNLFLTQK